MKAALLIVLSLSALAFAGPAFNKNTNNQIEADKVHQQQYMTGSENVKQTQAIETLKQWCFASQMSQPELTSSFKKLVGIVKSQPEDQSTQAAVMTERICQGALVQKSAQSGETVAQNGADALAHELIKDVYMDALIACESRDCMQQLLKIINSQQVDTVRASYYMTRIAVTEKDSIKDDIEIKQLAESFIQASSQQTSEAIERQKLFAVTALIGKSIKSSSNNNKQTTEIKPIAEQVCKTIVERYIKPVSQQEVQQYREQPAEQQSAQIAKKIAKRNAALKALANIPGWLIKEVQGVEEILMQLADNKQELATTRQSAIECLEENDKALSLLKKITLDQDDLIEVRVAAYRALMTVVYAGMKDEQSKQQMATDIVDHVVKHCEQERNQQQDDQFVLYVISHLDNLRTSQQPEHQAIKECITKNKQHYMQIQLLNKKFKQQLSDVRKSSRNYKLEQEFNQLESGLIVEGDLIYESRKQQHQQQPSIMPKVVRVNMSMPVMGETVNVIEIALRQNQMDQQLLGALKLVQSAKFNSESVAKVVDSFKTSVQEQQQQQRYNKQQQTAEADLSIKVDGCTVVYVCVDDFKTTGHSGDRQHQRNTRSVYSSYSIVDEIIEHLKRSPVAFNRGFNLNINKRLAKLLDVNANVIAGLRFESRAQGQSSKDFEIVGKVEPRFAFEAIVGPAKVTDKKLLQRLSTKTAVGFTLRFKQDELVDFQLDLPMNTMELFTVESQVVEKTQNSYSYLPESIYGQEDIYSPEEFYPEIDDEEDNSTTERLYNNNNNKNLVRKIKRSIFEQKKSTGAKIAKLIQGKRNFAHSLETRESFARATGLRAKLNVVASPKDMSFLLQAVAQKYEPRMQGYRVQVQKIQRSPEQKQYVFTMSTPGSRINRTMQVRVVEQLNQQRSVIKADIQSPFMTATAQYELIHDGRQYAIKAEIASTRPTGTKQQWRHSFECGFQRGSQSQSGRIASTYKPYLSIVSTELKRPIQMQGVVSYQQSPKSVISYELKCPTSGDFVQGKIILDERSSSSSAYLSKRSSQTFKRSSLSPIELLLQKDLTLTSELVAQVNEQAIKMHKMFDWDSSKWAVKGDFVVSHKNLRKSSVESQLSCQLKLDKDQQVFTVQRKHPQQERKEFRLNVVSDCKSTAGHQLVAEFNYNGKRQSNLQSVVAYKHKVDFNQLSANKLELGYVIELIASERQINEKIQGRTQVTFERKMKSIKTEMSSRDKSAKIDFDFVSLEQHQLELVLSTERYTHRTQVRADQRQFSVQSRTEKQGQMLAKIVLELLKQQSDCQLIIEFPTERAHFVADLKLVPGKLSSVAFQSPRYSSKTEFAFERSMFANKHMPTIWKRPFQAIRPRNNFRFKTDLKDTMNKEAYWMESQWNNEQDKSSFLRLDSPIYRTDLEFDPREQDTKFGLFARSKRSIANYNQLYTDDESIVNKQSLENKLQLANKLWMVRSLLSSTSSPSKVEELKQKARRALFEYADRRQQHKHQIQWNPIDERVNFQFERQPNTEFGQQSWQPMRFTGDLSTNWEQYKQQQQRPSTLSMESELIDFDFDTKPFDGEQAYAKLDAVSRYRRSPFKKHESEIRYNKQQGYKAWMKHQDSQDRRHSLQVETDVEPKKWTKMSFDSDKHGKTDYEHKWRKHVTKRSDKHQQHDEQVYANKIALESQSPDQKWSHRSQFEWEEPTHLENKQMSWGGRVRRDVRSAMQSPVDDERYSAVDYLKHINARFNSQTTKNQQELYNLNFDYQPESHARLSMQMPDDMLHSSSFEFEPTERVYKLHSKLVNRRTNEPSYELSAATKSLVSGLATADQEPVFIDEQHPMLERPISSQLAKNLFKQPLKLDYTDKYGRVARFDYDQSPIVATTDKYQGLRQKRAAVYYKDDSADFEHQSTYDFYPEAMLAGFKQTGELKQRQPADFSLKADTKFGPVLVKANSDDQTVELKLESPVMNAKLTGETFTGKRGSQLIKLTIDNKQQSAQLAKIVRKNPVLREFPLLHKLATKIDQGRFEHQSELLVSVVDAIFKLKSQTSMDQRSVMVIEGELNKQQEKCYVKINGQRTNGQLMVDLVTKSASLVLDVDDKRTIQHQTRLVRLSDKFFSLESMTSYKQQPLFKLSGKVSAMIFSEPQHLFARRRSASMNEEHVSTFEAVVYEPKQMQINAQYDCLKKEAHIIFKDVQARQLSDVRVQYNDQAERVYVRARTTGPRGLVYQVQQAINVSPIVRAY